jgi:arginine/glutamate-rich protein 1
MGFRIDIQDFYGFQAEERLKMIEDQMKIEEEKRKLKRREEKRIKEEQKIILGKGNARPKLSFSLATPTS